MTLDTFVATRETGAPRKSLRLGAAAAVALAGLISSQAAFAESRGFAISWFYPSVAAQVSEKDCPQGLNPDAAENVQRMLKDAGKTPEEIEEIMADFPHSVYAHIAMRGRIDGKPVSPYVNPTSVPDPNIKTVTSKVGYGFNLDGKVTEEDFVDPISGEAGVDNQLFRAYGCTAVMRADPSTRPTWTTIQWQAVQPQMGAWLIEVNGIDDMQNDDDVQVRIVQATRPVVLDAVSEVQADLTFVEDDNQVTKNELRGSIKDGILTTEPADIAMNGHRWAWPELRFKDGRIRLQFAEDGSAKGIIGGWHKWAPLYVPQAEGGAGYEGMLSMDLPGMYYAFRKLADADRDPETGLNLSVSTAFTIEAVPAFITHPQTQTAQNQ
jgi:hypothetical protein